MKYLFYPYLMGISAVIAIIVYNKRKTKQVENKKIKMVS